MNVLAVPGSAFVFQGNLSFLDLRAGRMTIDGTAEGKAMDIAFDPSRFAVSHDLHKGSSVNVTARFDGARYVATEIKVD